MELGRRKSYNRPLATKRLLTAAGLAALLAAGCGGGGAEGGGDSSPATTDASSGQAPAAPRAGIGCKTRAKRLGDNTVHATALGNSLGNLDIESTKYILTEAGGRSLTQRVDGHDGVDFDDLPDGTYTAEAELSGYGSCERSESVTVGGPSDFVAPLHASVQLVAPGAP